MIKPWHALARLGWLAWGAALAACAATAPPNAYTYQPALPAAYAPAAAVGAVAFRWGDYIEVFLPNYSGKPGRRPERFSFEPVGGAVKDTWLGHPYRLPRQADIVARAVSGPVAVADPRSGQMVVFAPPGTLKVVFPDSPRYRRMAGQTFYLVPAGWGDRGPAPAWPARTAWREPG
jgi:hypothetical protein